ncbi:nucleoside monophosphate kinase [Rubripirellula amarantea]|uniref:Adenylate kinase n=1 Tax=Rubripirellula amarantea TaxID=2527999 RepID=A0A5C5WHK8_9BACT|nr:nucleoside monophosphate kinase [Rubripirellula amarantea]MDA8743968.1 nucleoside monophosphate kinase [Rubripirellula amarantea]TWT50286.1 adenylate kinase [Rubripirellula amarantea]
MPDSINKPSAPVDLEVKDAQLIFNSVWKKIEDERGRENMRFPKELILLGGAPGAGKGTNTDFIREVRDISAPPIVVSSLLDTPEARMIKAKGGMVGDREVVGLLFEKLLEPEYQDGAILDGFPRTKVQVECLKLLYDAMIGLRREFADSGDLVHFRQPVFHIMVLFVDEAESVARQLRRGRQTIAHNETVENDATATAWEERPTDFNEELARNRYRVFKERTYDALVSLKQIFHYHFINAQASLEVVRENILSELEYQSSLELDPKTFHTLRKIPLASEIISHARRDLVKRLDEYEIEQPRVFHEVVRIIEEKMMPIIVRHAISGRAIINSEDPIWEETHALAMLIDVFSERGFHASIDITRHSVPLRFDLETGEINYQQKKVYRIGIRFKGSEIRRG